MNVGDRGPAATAGRLWLVAQFLPQPSAGGTPSALYGALQDLA
ncbi:hypothetical protein SAMN05216533_5956 [Streptomyces sp. Ag109_O5-10]|nr:hypothetical protein SAMN05216533_5956 [Streptomyces sp. Ag109_O5-10]